MPIICPGAKIVLDLEHSRLSGWVRASCPAGIDHLVHTEIHGLPSFVLERAWTHWACRSPLLSTVLPVSLVSNVHRAKATRDNLHRPGNAAGNMPVDDPLRRFLRAHSHKPPLIQHLPCLLPRSDREEAIEAFDYNDSVPGVYLDSRWIRVFDCVVERGRDDRFDHRI
jgi:hypothetical protein